MTNNSYNTLAEATQQLQKRGYTENFTIGRPGELRSQDGKAFKESDVTLDEFHRFEGMTNPSDSSIIYALSTKSGVKGTVIDAYGADGSEDLSEFLNAVKQNQYDDQD